MTFRRATTIAVALAFLSGIGAADLRGESGYAPRPGERPWDEQSADYWKEIPGDKTTCSFGYRQSPIDLVTSGQPALPRRQPRVNFAYDDTGSTQSALKNNGHSVELDPSEPGGERGILLDGKFYKLHDAHFHYPSEHLLDGRRFALEMHMVHFGPAGEAAVVAVLIDPAATTNATSPLDDLFTAMENLPTKASPPVKITFGAERLLAALPADRTYLRYEGSLTTPPCSETVTWLVHKTPVTMAQGKIDKFRDAITYDHPLLRANARPLQPANARAVQVSQQFLDTGRATFCEYRRSRASMLCAFLPLNRFPSGVGLDWGRAAVAWYGGPPVGDVNGDGRADYCGFGGDANNPQFTCALATGDGFFAPTVQATSVTGQDLIGDRSTGLSQFLADVNGDGKADFCRFTGTPSQNLRLSCLIAGASGFGPQTIESQPNFVPGSTELDRYMADVNGDGRADYCRVLGTMPNLTFSCALSNGTGFDDGAFQRTFTIPQARGKTSFLADVNGDGRADFCFLGPGAQTWMLSCALATGSGFGDFTFKSPESFDIGFDNRGRFLADVNGDGRADFCRLVGNDPANSFLGCTLAGPNGFSRDAGFGSTIVPHFRAEEGSFMAFMQ